MKLYVVTKTTESGQCYFDFENQFWVPIPLNGKRALTLDQEHASEVKRLFEHQDSRLHTFVIDIPEPKTLQPEVAVSGHFPGVPG